MISVENADDRVAEIPANWIYTGNRKTREIDGIDVYVNEQKLEQKFLWEQAVACETDRLGGDALLSDSCMTIFGRGLPRGTGLLPIAENYGLILNVHPALTQGKYANKGDSPTRNVRNWLESGVIPEIGATLHYVAREIDEGDIITFRLYTFHA